MGAGDDGAVWFCRARYNCGFYWVFKGLFNGGMKKVCLCRWLKRHGFACLFIGSLSWKGSFRLTD